ncbi:complex I subunit 4 family protein [Marinithermus hydrothermalis]|uniref:Proton-translocating NADH-quinone oxidoreductase, chain M n=1 Tax=Marinithermus hydrothermalis (strain DSM 14884 / JCM 11576 / T1) TaxID=869210 RepID=F2NM11_MARHT|nr:NADH-quinone oxidoreductase subunit M [Marinithermus hydrothermalis]AEB11268.1 proton-translocating NADH-quinone oxidoreductase, chain M [Marinithermus hydrothermalis DSM 14884]
MIHLFVFLPALAGLVALFAPGMARRLGIVASGLTFLIGLGLFAQYPGEGYAFVTQTPLLEPVGVYYALGLDGTSLALALAIALVTFAGLIVLRDVPGRMVALALLMETGLLGIVSSLDLILFYVFYEATLIPSMLMLGLFGGQNRVRALVKFALFTLTGSLLMLAAILAARYLGGAESFLLEDLLAHRLDGAAAVWAFAAFALAFLVKTPLFPVHTWLPDFHAENHPSGLADVMGTLYKVGLYGFFRWAMPLFPAGFAEFQGLLLALAAVTALYGAWVAFAQTDWKRLLAYGALSHMGVGALGLFSGTEEGAIGAIFLLAASSVYTGALFLFAGMMHRRFGTLELTPTRGLAQHAPALAAFTLILVLAMVGLPGLAGFPGEFMSLLGAWQASPWLTLVGFSAVIASAAYALTAYQRVFHETPERPAGDLSRREWAFAVLATLGIVLLGVYPKVFSAVIEPSAQVFAQLVGGGL